MDSLQIRQTFGYTKFKESLSLKHTFDFFKYTATDYSLLITFYIGNNKLYFAKKNTETEFKKVNFKELSNSLYNGIYNMFPTTDQLIKLSAVIKIKNYEKSAELFGFTPSKRKMYESSLNENKLYTINDILPDYPCKYDNQTRHVVEVKNEEGKNLKFLLDDLEIIYPDINKLLKGITLPKDRTITKNKVVIVKKGQFKGLKGTVKHIDYICDSKTYATVSLGQGPERKINFKYLKVE